MPSEAVSLALAASIYPPALAVIIALGRGTEVRLRVLLLVVGAFVAVLVTGSLMLLLFTEAGAGNKPVRTASAGLYIAAGAALLWLAIRLRNRDANAPKKEGGPSKTDRYLESARLVFVLGVILYVIPSPIYVGVVKAIADTHASTAQQLVYLVQALLIMLWMIEIPMLLLLAFPARGTRILEGVNAWFARNGQTVAVLVAGGAGVYLIAVGLVELV
jgi:Sap, sulfolipid-1-addressing protein